MSYNIHGLANKVLFPDFFDLVKSADVFVLLETWVEENDNKKFEKYFGGFILFFKGAIRENKKGHPRGGMLIGVKKELSCKIDYKIISNIQQLTLKFSNSILNIIPIYLNPSCWQNNLNELKYYLDEQYIENLVLLGDFNARIGKLQEADENVINNAPNVFPNRRSEDISVNDQGRKVVDLFENCGLMVLNGRTTGDEEGHHTFIRSKSVIDLGVVSCSVTNYVESFKVLSVDHSDHLAIEMKINILDSGSIKSTENQEIPRLRWDSSKVDEYKRSLDNELGRINTAEAGTIEILKNVIYKLGKKSDSKSNFKFREKWFDFACFKSRKKSFKYFNDFRKYKGNCKLLKNILFGRYKVSNFEYKSLCEKKYKEFYEDLGRQLNTINTSQEWWKWVKKFKDDFRSSETPIDNALLSEHFSVLLNKENSMPVQYCEPFLEDPFLDAPISILEIRKSLESLKDGKSPGFDGIGIEFYKYGSDSLYGVLQSHYNKVMNHETALGNQSIIVALHKKGDKCDPTNYRGISRISSEDKIYAKLLFDRLEKWVDSRGILCEYQCGFRKGYSTFDNIFNVMQIVKLSWNRGIKKVYLFFVDFKAAFDGVIRSSLFYKLYQMGISSKFLSGIRALYEGTMNAVWCNNKLSPWFQSSSGLRQGCILSPLLFSLFINDMHTFLGGGVEIEDIKVNILLYADDIVIISESPHQLQRMINRLFDYCKTWQLEVNLSKSQIMIMKEGGGIRCGNEHWYYGRTEIEVVKTYKYLGLILTPSLNMNLNYKDKISAGKFKIFGVWKEFVSNKYINLENKTSLFNAVTRSGVCYSSQVIGYENYEQVNALQRQFVRKILFLPNGTPNHVLRVECGVKDLYNYTLRMHMKYVQKILFKYEDNRLPKILALVGMRKKMDWWKKWEELGEKVGVHWDLSLGFNTWSVNINNILKYIEDNELSTAVAISRRSENVYGALSYMNGNGIFKMNLRVSEISMILKARCDLLPLNDKPWKSNSMRICPLCSLRKKECSFHFVCECPMLADIRAKWFGVRTLDWDRFHCILEGENWNNLIKYLLQALDERNIIIEIL